MSGQSRSRWWQYAFLVTWCVFGVYLAVSAVQAGNRNGAAAVVLGLIGTVVLMGALLSKGRRQK